MVKNKFENVTDEELLKEQKKLKSLNKIYGIVLFLLLITAIYLAVSKSNFTIVAVFLALFSIFIVNLQSLKDFKKEVEKRSLK